SIDLLIASETSDAQVIDSQLDQARIEIVPKKITPLRIRLPDWADPTKVTATIDDRPCELRVQEHYVHLSEIRGGSRVTLAYPLRRFDETITIPGLTVDVRWIGDTVVSVAPPGSREPTYENRTE